MFKDPFGRLLAEPKPDREILNFQNPLSIRDSIGMEGMNSRRDVAKVENLLGRAGALDLSKTDGVTGFFGARTDEAVRTFQKDRGLKVDGLINPRSPTMRTLIAEAGQHVATRLLPTAPPRVGLLPEPEIKPEPRKDNIRNFVLRLREMQKNGIDPKAHNFANAGGQSGKDTAGASDQNSPEADIMGKLQGLIEELKDQQDPRAGDIDTDAGGRRPPLQHNEPSPQPEKEPLAPERDAEDRLKKQRIDALINILDTFTSLYFLRGMKAGQQPKGPNIQFAPPGKGPKA
ncbi:MAG: peptidoglycan-binding domain-containing protein [Proteobacteria bacterium]|nr:peptidoglycan-binding domain-containing protein [Pseudomonadota bacterium]MDA1022275.1 peptidoglycan-binding domain-containing protein [Pseudomonadota bacterium]